jgi:hypothetical protein
MQQYVKWNFDTNTIERGPQGVKGDGDNWYSIIQVGKVVNPRTQVAVYTFNEELGGVIMSVEGSPSLLYNQARLNEYGSIGNQLDMIWRDINNNTLDKTGEFYSFIKNIKESNPK